MARDQSGADLRVNLVGFQMCAKKSDSIIIGDSVEALESVDFGARDGRNLRFIDVERRESRGKRSIAGQSAIRVDEDAGRSARPGAEHGLACDAEA